MALPTLLTLKEAAKMLGDSVKPASLSTEIRRGRLPSRKIGGRTYVTESDLEEMLSACLANQSPQDSGPEKMDDHLDGSSSTGELTTAQVAALMTVKELRKSSRHTLRGSTSQSAAKPH